MRFDCTQCGACCTTHGEYAYVYLSGHDVRAIAHFLDLSRESFLATFCREEEGFVMLRMDRPACPFLGADRRCGIYPVRPKQCATWPFWQENLERSRWEGVVREICPGIGRGPRVSAAEIERLAHETEAWYEEHPPEGER